MEQNHHDRNSHIKLKNKKLQFETRNVSVGVNNNYAPVCKVIN